MNHAENKYIENNKQFCYSDTKKSLFRQSTFLAVRCKHKEREEDLVSVNEQISISATKNHSPFNLTALHQRLSQLLSMGFKLNCSIIQNYVFLNNIALIIASVIHIRTRVINFYLI